MALLSHLNEDDLRALCLDALRKLTFVTSTQLGDFLRVVGQIAFERDLPKGEPGNAGLGLRRLSEEDDDRITDVLSDFYIDGIIRPGPITSRGNTAAMKWPFFHLTPRGKAIIASPTPSPYDPSGFLGEIRAVPGMDDVVVSYVDESVDGLRHHRHRSSVIMLGVASERAFTLFLEAVVGSINDKVKSKAAEGHLYEVTIQRAFDEFTKRYKAPLIVALKNDKDGKPLAHNFDTYLGSLLINIKEYRNDAGHAVTVATSRRVAEAHLGLFPDYVAKVFGLIAWLKTHQIVI